jgi:Leucine-rich repeat (LRR) protein
MNTSTIATILGAAALGLMNKNSGSFSRTYKPKTLKSLLKRSKKKALEVTSLDIIGLIYYSKSLNNVEPFPKWVIKMRKRFEHKEDFLGEYPNLFEGILAQRNEHINRDCEILSSVFKKFINVKYLWLMSNNLSRLPEDISLLQEIKHLDLSNNIIYELPDGFSDLKSLETLILTENFLFDIPKQIFDLENLEVLKMSDIEIDKIPMSICNLKKLRILSLRKINNPPTVSEIKILSKNLHPDVMKEILNKSKYNPQPPSQLRRF